MTVLINGRDEPRIVFDVGSLFEALLAFVIRSLFSNILSCSINPPTLAQALTPSDPTPFALSPPRTGAFFAQPERKDVCRPARGVGGVRVPFLVSASSAEFTTTVLSMTKLADASTSLSGGVEGGGGGSCFTDVLVPGESTQLNSTSLSEVTWSDFKSTRVGQVEASIREVAHKPYEPSDGFCAVRKHIANGVYGFAHP
ncbi:hypothetical protein B0H13DRAFT_1871598 [Mycena leptocephala]|nr:hypothetical protein B0H13DRAFT_1871598 [Mycena leptocephala]